MNRQSYPGNYRHVNGLHVMAVQFKDDLTDFGMVSHVTDIKRGVMWNPEEDLGDGEPCLGQMHVEVMGGLLMESNEWLCRYEDGHYGVYHPDTFARLFVEMNKSGFSTIVAEFRQYLMSIQRYTCAVAQIPFDDENDWYIDQARHVEDCARETFNFTIHTDSDKLQGIPDGRFVVKALPSGRMVGYTYWDSNDNEALLQMNGEWVDHVCELARNPTDKSKFRIIGPRPTMPFHETSLCNWYATKGE